jgi:ferredoxin-NADP reductase
LLDLAAPGGEELPGFTAGSHLVVGCGEKANAYSLTGEGLFPERYTISVLRQENGQGGSMYMHGLAIGDTVRASRPRSAFAPVADARLHLLIAGGIGITPILSHARAAAAWGRPAAILYVHAPGSDAHLDDLERIARASGFELAACAGRAALPEAIAAFLDDRPLGSHLYTCGPEGFMDRILDDARAAGWPEERLHSEAFGAAALDPGEPFTVALANSGERVDVPAGVSLLEALEESGRAIPHMCRQGVCGECILPVRRGRPLHRDSYLSDDERASAIMPCVSRCLDSELELDL